MKENDIISASWAELMEQGVSAADYYMQCAVDRIDKLFGKGYASNHPELVGDFMKTVAIEANGQSRNKCMQICTNEIVEEISVLSDNLLNASNYE